MIMIEQLKTSDIKDIFQRFVKDFVQPLEVNPLIDGRHIRGLVVPTAGTLTVNHLLDRVPVGWIITDITEDQKRDRIYRTGWTEKNLVLANGAGSDTTVDIWVF